MAIFLAPPPTTSPTIPAKLRLSCFLPSGGFSNESVDMKRCPRPCFLSPQIPRFFFPFTQYWPSFGNARSASHVYLVLLHWFYGTHLRLVYNFWGLLAEADVGSWWASCGEDCVVSFPLPLLDFLSPFKETLHFCLFYYVTTYLFWDILIFLLGGVLILFFFFNRGFAYSATFQPRVMKNISVIWAMVLSPFTVIFDVSPSITIFPFPSLSTCTPIFTPPKISPVAQNSPPLDPSPDLHPATLLLLCPTYLLLPLFLFLVSNPFPSFLFWRVSCLFFFLVFCVLRCWYLFFFFSFWPLFRVVRWEVGGHLSSPAEEFSFFDF